ncbi:acyltransferase [Asticcacaulis sp. EMRT-3]|uniref:acyltransferase family protein n=1 Tax=Asticcacaulis sp. EMRT-3 TaxID=3040349 RepID=UPI0024AFFEAA|nr:acyltransferase [Asticcacaulis sp. EMRT-3]MDI7775232.1 acyltransferase [Asticcacaulis sp. EMRT-3]
MTGSGDSPKVTESRFYELDILRGLAAFMVVTFHYKHFLLISDAAGFDYHDMPFHTVLMPVYVYGQFFVELFFSISGYVFFWLYSGAISTRQTGLRSFFIARFARLYPLYFMTFIAVALIQWAFHTVYGHDFIYSHNGPINFVLNLFMVHQWRPHANQSFNGPSWSISVEVFLYVVFFLLCRFRLNSVWTAMALVVAGLVFKYLHPDPTDDFVRGLPSFFLGGLAWYAVEALRQRETWRRRAEIALVTCLPILWLLAYICAYDALWHPARHWLRTQGFGLTAALSTEGFVYGLIPLTLVYFGLRRNLWQAAWLKPDSLHRIAWIGDISYSLYLIHFPLQISIMLVMAHWPFAARAHIFGSPLTFVAFMGTAMGLAWLSFRFFEMPMRKHIRNWLTPHLARIAPMR